MSPTTTKTSNTTRKPRTTTKATTKAETAKKPATKTADTNTQAPTEAAPAPAATSEATNQTAPAPAADTSNSTSSNNSANNNKSNQNNQQPQQLTPRQQAAMMRMEQAKQRGRGRGWQRGNNRSNNNNSNNNNSNYNNQNFGGVVDGRVIPDAGMPTEDFRGVLDMNKDGNGVLRSKFAQSDNDAYISGTQIRRFRLRPGDEVVGPARRPKDNEQYWGLLKVDKINGRLPDEMMNRVKFRNLTPVYPDKKLVLETTPDILSTRLIDLVAPVGMGQRGLIVSPPKAGKTTVIKEVATGIAQNFPDVHLMAVLVGERPEEVTDIDRHIAQVTGGKGEVAASNFDEQPTDQVRVSELALERACRLVEMGQHVVILLDSITRLARAYNLAMPTSGRTLSGGFDPAALYPPKRFFGAARNFETYQTPDGEKDGSLTILGTALTDTGSRMDDLIYEEFKGTGNMELHLARELAERRIWPAIDVQRSGTRREDLLFSNTDYQSVVMMRRMIDMLDPKERTAVIVNRMKNTKNNKEFLATLKEG